jgi:hypothetical protein
MLLLLLIIVLLCLNVRQQVCQVAGAKEDVLQRATATIVSACWLQKQQWMCPSDMQDSKKTCGQHHADAESVTL